MRAEKALAEVLQVSERKAPCRRPYLLIICIIIFLGFVATQLLLGTGLISDDWDDTTGSLLVIGTLLFTETQELQNAAPAGCAKYLSQNF